MERVGGGGDEDEEEAYARAVSTLTGSIKSHYRSKGSDAEANFAQLATWLEARRAAPRRPTFNLALPRAAEEL